MTARTAVRKDIPRLFQRIGRGLSRVRFLFRVSRNCEVTRRSSNNALQIRRLISSAEPPPDHDRAITSAKDHYSRRDQRQTSPSCHIPFAFTATSPPRSREHSNQGDILTKVNQSFYKSLTARISSLT